MKISNITKYSWIMLSLNLLIYIAWAFIGKQTLTNVFFRIFTFTFILFAFHGFHTIALRYYFKYRIAQIHLKSAETILKNARKIIEKDLKKRK